LIFSENVSPPTATEVDHSFEYTSFDHATECDQCKKLLRGIFFQGYRCTRTFDSAARFEYVTLNVSGCKLSVHKECITVCHGCGRKDSIFRNSGSREGSQVCIAVRSFIGNNGGPSFLSFKENDLIEVVSINTGLEGWWRGRIIEGECCGRTGLFPPDYVRRHNSAAAASAAAKRPTWPCSRSSSALSHTSGLSLNGRDSFDEKSVNTLHRKAQSRPTSLTTLGYLNLEDLPLYPWYVGEMDRIKAEQVLKGLPIGTFLIRFSPSQSRYAISISYSVEKIDVKHIKVERNERGFYLDVGQFFPSLVQLVNFYEENSLSQSFQSLDTTLKIPVKSLIVGYAIALHNFEATASNMISIHRGEGVIILSKKDSERGWWKGKVDEKVGYFPCSYVVEKDDLFADA
uniref:SH3 domain-containing protein n=1 Tax=Soboliphyme baturini TaxID=241478 RepID=A0A183IQA9_9BILA